MPLQRIAESALNRIAAVMASLKTACDDSPIGLFALHDGDRLINSNAAFRGMLKQLMSSKSTRLSRIFGVDVAEGCPPTHASDARLGRETPSATAGPRDNASR